MTNTLKKPHIYERLARLRDQVYIVFQVAGPALCGIGSQVDVVAGEDYDLGFMGFLGIPPAKAIGLGAGPEKDELAGINAGGL